MKYETQKIAYNYFVIATVLFGLQVIFGLITGAKYVWDHDPLINILPFNISRAIHMNLLIVWLLMGFMGGTYYLVPEEAEKEIYSPKLAHLQLFLFTAIGVTAITGYILRWSWGMPFLEQPTILKIGIAIVAVIFLFNIFMTMIRTKKWTEWIEDQIKNPKSHNPNSIMPGFARLPEKDLEDLADYLSGLK